MLQSIKNFIMRKDIRDVSLKRVKDGDTILFENEDGEINLRLYGIDTPEKFVSLKLYKDIEKSDSTFNRILGKNVSKEEMVEAGKKATDYVKDLLNKETTYQIEIIEEDRHGRFVGIVYIDGKSLNEKILKDGYARAYPYYIRSKYLKMKYQWHDFFAKWTNQGLWKTDKNVMKSII